MWPLAAQIPLTTSPVHMSRLSQCRESDSFVTRAKIPIASEMLPGFVPNPAPNLTRTMIDS